MPARIATTYRVAYSPKVTMWRSSFKTALFSYGLPLEDILIDEIDITVIRKEKLYTILEKMKGDMPNHKITDSTTVASVALALQQVLEYSDPHNPEVRIKWDE